MKKFRQFYINEDKKEPSIKVLMLNCSLKSSGKSNTESLLEKISKLYSENYDNVKVEIVRVSKYNIEKGIEINKINENDDFPDIYDKIQSCDILIIGTALWFGERTSIVQSIMERMIGSYTYFNEYNQPSLYGKVGSVVVTGNEDGAHNASATTLYNLSKMGCLIPPNANSYWVGDAGPGPSYIESNGEENYFTNKSALYLVHNTVHFSNLMKETPYKIDIKKLDNEAVKMSKKAKDNRKS